MENLLISFLHDTSKKDVYIGQWSKIKSKSLNMNVLIIYY